MKRIVLLENIRSLHNVGAIFRNTDSAGWNGVILSGYTGTPPDRRIEKVSLGAENSVEWEQIVDPLEAIEKYRQKGFEIYALEQTSDAVDIFAFEKVQKDLLLVLGNEVEGVSPEVLKKCDLSLEIPMHGSKGSLNVSVASGVAFYALRS